MLRTLWPGATSWKSSTAHRYFKQQRREALLYFKPMKIKLIILFLLSAIGATAQKSFTATYEYYGKPDSLNLQKLKDDIFELQFTNSKSQFYSRLTFERDSVGKAQSGATQSLGMQALPKAGERYTVETDISSSKTTVYQNYALYKYYYDDSVKIDWQLAEGNKKLNGYDCLKATAFFRGRNYTAWYAPEIALPLGPYLFKGLPGLVMEVSDSREHYSFRLIQLRFDERKNPIALDGYTQITREEFLKFYDKVMYDTTHSLLSQTTNLTDEQKKRLADVKKARKRENNNLMEIKE